MIQLLITQDSFKRQPESEGYRIETGIRANKLWMDTAWTSLYEAEQNFPDETFRKVKIANNSNEI